MSSSATTNPYTYIKPSGLATRSLISEPSSKPTATTTSASHDHPEAHDRPVLHRKQTDNYEQARERSKLEEAAGEEGEDRPRVDRKQSWTMEERRRVQHEKLVGEEVRGPGYYSTGS